MPINAQSATFTSASVSGVKQASGLASSRSFPAATATLKGARTFSVNSRGAFSAATATLKGAHSISTQCRNYTSTVVYRYFDTIVSTPVLSGTFTYSRVLTGTVDSPATFSGLTYHYRTGLITSYATLNSFPQTANNPAASLEASFDSTGYRPSVSVLAYLVDTLTSEQIEALVPDNRSFVMSSSFLGTAGNDLFDAGAAADYVGTRVVDEIGNSSYIFREPEKNEVIWYVPKELLYRYEFNRDAGVWVWRPYRSLPQRSLDGQVIFEMFDPDKVYDYYAKIWGSLYWRWSYDLGILRDQLDPYSASEKLLPIVSQQFGLRVNAGDDVNVKRAKVYNAIDQFKAKGTSEGVRLRLRDIGYVGYSADVWINPGYPAVHLHNYTVSGYAKNAAIISTSSALEVYGFFGGSTTRNSRAFIVFKDFENPADGDTITIASGSQTKIFEFDSNSSVSGGHVAVAINVDPFVTASNLATAITANLVSVDGIFRSSTTEALWKATANPDNTYYQPARLNPAGNASAGTYGTGSDTLEYPTNYRIENNIVMKPSSRVSIHINNLDGTPINFAGMNTVAINTIQQTIFNELTSDILPAHVDIRYFATDLNVNGPYASENIGATDRLTVTLNAVRSYATGTVTVTVHFAVPHGFSVGNSIVISGLSPGSYNGTFTVATTASPYTLTYTYAAGADPGVISGIPIVSIL